ncbi:MAG: hypothetical protein ACJA09_003081 [Alcanivorax sp.]|jgi:hypothetical protein
MLIPAIVLKSVRIRFFCGDRNGKTKNGLRL